MLMSARTWGLAVLGVAASAAVVSAGAPPWNFDTDAVGRLPEGFSLAAMRQPSAGAWLVQREGTNGWLVHRAQPGASDGYAMALAPGEALHDVQVSVRLRLAGGSRAGGVLWRYRDPRNYYMAVLDLAQGELELYRVNNGHRVTLDRRDDLELDVNAWHRLKVVHVGRHAAVSLGGIRVFDERDRHDAAPDAWAAGLVATGGSDVWFDDLRIEPDTRRE